MNNDNDCLRTMVELARLKGNGKKSVVWKLSAKTVSQVKEKYSVETELYEIRTKHLKNIRDERNPILKEQHFAFKQNKKTIVRPLSEKDKEDLEKRDVKYRPYKYRIQIA